MFTLHGPTMGTRYSAKFIAPKNINLNVIQNSLQRVVDKVDNQMSPWQARSNLVQFNDTPVNQWFDIPVEMAVVIDEALTIGRLSDGAFNIGVGNIVDAWGFGPTQSASKIDKLKPGEALEHAHKTLELDMDKLRLKKHSPIAIDLCGIAKGFGVDEMADVLTSYNIENYLVCIDGEMKANGLKSDGSPWVLGVEMPDYVNRHTVHNLEVSNIAIATSGDYRHVKQINNTKFSHTIDTSTGSPSANNIASVTVFDEHCIHADAWATAFLVMGAKRAMKLATEMEIEALIFERQPEGLRQTATSALKQSGLVF